MKTILVSLSHPAYNSSVLVAAASIAKKYDCHIIGLHVTPSIMSYGKTIDKIDVTSIYAQLISDYEEHAKKTRRVFEEFVEREGLDGEWRLVKSRDHLVEPEAIKHGHEADLVILGCRAPNSTGDNYIDSVAEIVRGVGRPVLLVPKSKSRRMKLSRIVVGWDGSREAARAAFDSIPLQKMAKKVTLFSINPRKNMGWDTDLPGSELATSLSRHDINVVTESIKTRKRDGKVLLERCKNSDLLVMGAYGHSRLREAILGGVTASVLKKTCCPVLLSS